jgi:predicted HTH domain antitoxin
LSDKSYQFKVQELMMFELIHNNQLSFGKAAELLGIGKIQLIADLGKAGLPYFELSLDEVLDDAETARRFSEAH